MKVSDKQSEAMCELLVAASFAFPHIIGDAHTLHYHAVEFDESRVASAVRAIRREIDGLTAKLEEVEALFEPWFQHEELEAAS